MNKAEKLAEEECFEYHGCFTGDCPHEKAKDCAKYFYLAGWNARDHDLRESSEEFDEKAPAVAAEKIWQDGALISQFDYVEGARYQHSQDQLKYQALFSAYSKLDNINIELNHRIMDLKAEIENSNKFAQDQEIEINTLAFEKAKSTQAYVLRIQELEAENAKLKARYEVKYEGRS